MNDGTHFTVMKKSGHVSDGVNLRDIGNNKVLDNMIELLDDLYFSARVDVVSFKINEQDFVAVKTEPDIDTESYLF